MSIGIGQRAEMRAFGPQALDHLEQVGQRTGETVDAGNQQRIALPHPRQGRSELRPTPFGTGGVFLEQRGASGGEQDVALWAEALVFRRHPGVTDQAHGLLRRRAGFEPLIFRHDKCL